MKRVFVASMWLMGLIGHLAWGAEVHLVCTGKKLISADGSSVWSDEIIVDLESAKVIKFETSWTLAAKSEKYAIEAVAEVDDSTIKIYDRVSGDGQVWEKVFVISRVDGSAEAIVTETGSVAIRGKCIPATDRAF